MNQGVVIHPLVPCRKEPSDKAELVTQLLFGEDYRVLEESKKWVLIENASDHYQAWIDRKMHTPTREPLSDYRPRTADTLWLQSEGLPLPFGSRLHRLENGKFHLANKSWNYSGEIGDSNPANIIPYAKKFLGAPYLWGGKSILGIDCSGLVQLVFDAAGISMPRDAWQQAEKGVVVDFVDLSEAGDLAFFDNEDGRITHVGIVIEPGKIIHASGSVRIDRLDHQGIFHINQQSYSHQLRVIKRIAP
jgi:cell wall-associated NlpC family hydrolase